ncbi:SDR family oxidoreductase [Dyella sp. A6]|uniref:SDR family oxidoreductase n=1 Tax=Dyella aluminiiresistens TaxID=3069105 RepID=UPI002E777E18|nr:SDR family NAD(P)-dependent oxidoreductase [Dyella sp. A6]
MKLTGNTIFITGGGSGIGRAIAEAFHRRGNKVIIAGRRRAQLEAVAAANPGIDTVELDVSDPASITSVAQKLVADYPKLNVLFNNAGVMIPDNAAGVIDDTVMQTHIDTNLLGSIRMTSALIEHLKQQSSATVLYNTSSLAFTPLAPFAVYSATKAALHSYVMSQRFMLRQTSVRVQEIAPPWVGTGLVGDANDERAMPLDRFVEGTMAALESDAEEVLVEEARIYRNNPGPKEHAFVTELNTAMTEALASVG